jgi:hypothetical protein
MNGTAVSPTTPLRALEPAFPVWLLALAGIAVALLFVSVGDDGYWPGWARAVWNFGHAPLFATLAWLGWRWLPGRRAWRRWAIGMGAALLLGVVIELAQLTVGGREVSLGDVMLDLGGAWLGFWWVNHRRAWRRSRTLATVLLMLSLLVAIAAAWPVMLAGGSAIAAHRYFPVLLAGDMPLLTERLGSTGDSALRITPAGLEVVLGGGIYAGFKVYDGPRDWRGFDELVVVIDNSTAAELPLTCRIHDVPHDLTFSDRFNRTFPLAPGSNTLVMPLAEVIAAPLGRTMAIDDMLEVGCFVHRGGAGARLLVREIRLR